MDPDEDLKIRHVLARRIVSRFAATHECDPDAVELAALVVAERSDGRRELLDACRAVLAQARAVFDDEDERDNAWIPVLLKVEAAVRVATEAEAPYEGDAP